MKRLYLLLSSLRKAWPEFKESDVGAIRWYIFPGKERLAILTHAFAIATHTYAMATSCIAWAVKFRCLLGTYFYIICQMTKI